MKPAKRRQCLGGKGERSAEEERGMTEEWAEAFQGGGVSQVVAADRQRQLDWFRVNMRVWSIEYGV
jgi:hypothetical protein